MISAVVRGDVSTTMDFSKGGAAMADDWRASGRYQVVLVEPRLFYIAGKGRRLMALMSWYELACRTEARCFDDGMLASTFAD